MVMELPEEFKITVNGQKVECRDQRWWRDISFRRIGITGLLRRGENLIQLERRFTGEAEKHARMADRTVHESERNRIRYGTELESIYIIGHFGVVSRSGWEELERKTICTNGPFVLVEQPGQIGDLELVRQGFPFFAGSVLLRQKIEFPEGKFDPNSSKVYLGLDPPDAVVTEVWVNGKETGALVWRPYRVEVTDYLHPGTNEIAIELINSCRNLLGPHHHIYGELYFLGADSFLGRRTWTDGPDRMIIEQKRWKHGLQENWYKWKTQIPENTWTDSYSFVRFGLSGTPKLIWMDFGPYRC